MWNILWKHPLGGKVLSTEFRSWGAADTAAKTDTVSLKNGWKPEILAQAEPGLPAILIVQDRRPADAKRTRTAAAKRLSGPEVSGLAPVAEELAAGEASGNLIDSGAGELAMARLRNFLRGGEADVTGEKR